MLRTNGGLVEIEKKTIIFLNFVIHLMLKILRFTNIQKNGGLKATF